MGGARSGSARHGWDKTWVELAVGGAKSVEVGGAKSVEVGGARCVWG